MTATNRSRVSPGLAACAFFALFLVLYLLTLSNHYSADGMAFAGMATSGPAGSHLFFQAEHLLYPAVPWLWYQLWGLFGYAEGALRPLQTLNAIAGAAGVTLLFLALRLILKGKAGATLLSLLAASAVGVSYGYWYHSTEAEDQTIALAFVMASLLLVVSRANGADRSGLQHQSRRLRSTSSFQTAAVSSNAANGADRCGLQHQSRRLRSTSSFQTAAVSSNAAKARRIASLSLTASLAVLFHGAAILIAPALLLGLDRWRHRLGFIAGMGLVLGFSYLGVGAAILGFRSPADFWQWASSAPAKGVWGHLQLSNLTQGARTLSTSVLYSGNFPNLIGTDSAPALAPFSRIITLVLLGALLLVAGHAAYRWRREKSARIALVWLAALAAFTLYWAPGDIQFWIAAVIPMAMLAAMAGSDLLGRYPARLAWLGVIAVAALFSGNLFGAMAPRSDLSTNRGYAQALCLRDRTSEADVIVTPGWDWASSYLPYFAHREVLSLVDVYLLEAQGDKERFASLVRQGLSATWNRGGKAFGVRLFPPEEKERAWFIEAAGFDPGAVGLKGKAAGQCLGEPLWEIQP